MLGVTFSTEIYNIWDVNYNDIIKKVHGVCKQCSKRKLTLMGRITIIKSLALAKFIHLLLALPNPPDNSLKNIEKIIYIFYGMGGPDRIKLSIIVKNIKAGGLRMINLSEFIKALKISWLRRVIQNSEIIAWHSLSKIDFNKLFSCGPGYSVELSKNLHNPFCKDCLNSWSKVCNVCKLESVNHILCSPIWFNNI